MNARHLSVVVLGGALVLACEPNGASSARRSTGFDTAGVDARLSRGAAVPRDTVAAVQIQWTVAEVLERLRASGIQWQSRGEVRQPFLAVRGTAVAVEGAELQVYIYGDAGAAGRDVAPLDTNRVAPSGMMITWTAPPSLIWHNNLVAILLTRDEQSRARIKQALRPGAHWSGGRQ